MTIEDKLWELRRARKHHSWAIWVADEPEDIDSIVIQLHQLSPLPSQSFARGIVDDHNAQLQLKFAVGVVV